jgi:hypothetical protein
MDRSKKIISEVERLFEALGVSPDELPQILRELGQKYNVPFAKSRGNRHDLLAQPDPVPSVPTVDSIAHLRGREAWVARKGENPAAFIRRVYADVLAAGTLTRGQLGQSDPPLNDAYAVWITPRRHPEDNLGLPTSPRCKFTSAEETLVHRRKLVRESTSRHRARKRNANLTG